jgi:hypothetical protein
LLLVQEKISETGYKLTSSTLLHNSTGSRQRKMRNIDQLNGQPEVNRDTLAFRGGLRILRDCLSMGENAAEGPKHDFIVHHSSLVPFGLDLSASIG